MAFRSKGQRVAAARDRNAAAFIGPLDAAPLGPGEYEYTAPNGQKCRGKLAAGDSRDPAAVGQAMQELMSRNYTPAA